MRSAGRISNWNDAKGFGFVTPVDGGDRAFVHIKAFQARSRRPADGDLISYLATRDSRGRLNAAEIRFAGAPAVPKPQSPSTKPWTSLRAVLGSIALLVVFAGWYFDRIPVAVALVALGLSLASYLFYWRDKVLAGRGGRRIPEANLHALDLLGGWPGGLIAQQVHRHKVSKTSFQIKTWLVIVANVAVVTYLARMASINGVP